MHHPYHKWSGFKAWNDDNAVNNFLFSSFIRWFTYWSFFFPASLTGCLVVRFNFFSLDSSNILIFSPGPGVPPCRSVYTRVASFISYILWISNRSELYNIEWLLRYLTVITLPAFSSPWSLFLEDFLPLHASKVVLVALFNSFFFSLFFLLSCDIFLIMYIFGNLLSPTSHTMSFSYELWSHLIGMHRQFMCMCKKKVSLLK